MRQRNILEKTSVHWELKQNTASMGVLLTFWDRIKSRAKYILVAGILKSEFFSGGTSNARKCPPAWLIQIMTFWHRFFPFIFDVETGVNFFSSLNKVEESMGLVFTKYYSDEDQTFWWTTSVYPLPAEVFLPHQSTNIWNIFGKTKTLCL